MRTRIMIALVVIGFCAPWVMVAQQMMDASPVDDLPQEQVRSAGAPKHE